MENTKSTTQEVPENRSDKTARKTLAPREMEFVNAYQGNVSAAARAIGMARRNAAKMMKLPRVAKAIDKKIEEALKASGRKLAKTLCMTAEEVNHGIARLAKYDLRKCVTDTNSVIPLKQWEDNEGLALCSFKITDVFEGSGEDRVKTGELKEFKMADRGQNLERMGRILGMFIERHMTDLPHDWDSHTIEEKRFYVANKGRWPEPDELQAT